MYKDLKKLYDGTRKDFFVMAIGYLLDKGYDFTSQITEDDITELEGNGLMTKEFCQDLVRTAVDIAKASDGVHEIVQFCQAEDIFEVQFYANKVPRDRLETLLHNAIGGMVCNDYDGESLADLADYIGATEDEMEMLGMPIEEDEDE